LEQIGSPIQVDKVSGRYQEKYQNSEQEIRQPEKDGTLGVME
jgi:hypothetical protein